MGQAQSIRHLLAKSDQHLENLRALQGAGKSDDALLALVEALSEMADLPIVRPDARAADRTKAYRQWASTMIGIIGSASLSAIKRSYFMLARQKSVMATILAAARWDHLDPEDLLGRFAPTAPDFAHLLRKLLVATLKTLHLVTGKNLGKFDPNALVPIMMACLSQKVVMGQQEHLNRQWLLANANILRRYDPSKFLGLAPYAAYMFSSYAVGAEKHLIKKVINGQVQRTIEQLDLLGKPQKTRQTREKPTILVVSDIYKQSHAIMRCHGADIDALKKSFRCVLVTYTRNINDDVRASFDDVIAFDTSESATRSAVQQCQEQAPDLVYFPSIGLGLMSLIFSNIRLAPIQLMALGHPASSFSDAVDYVVMNNDLRPDPVRFSEKLIHRKISAGYLPHAGMQATNQPTCTPDPGTVQIGILGYPAKLSMPFIKSCKIIAERATTPVRFHFFPNDSMSVLQAVRAEIDHHLPGAMVHCASPYPDYLAAIDRLDMVLSTFPFGNTNGTVDALLRNKPVVTLCGPEPHSRTDARLMRKLGVPEWLITSHVDDYMSAALRLIDNEQDRRDIGQQIRNLDPASCFFGADEVNDFDEVVRYIYECHDLLQRSEARQFDFSELEMMANQQSRTPETQPT